MLQSNQLINLLLRLATEEWLDWVDLNCWSADGHSSKYQPGPESIKIVLLIPRLQDRANIEQASSKHQAGLMESSPLAQM